MCQVDVREAVCRLDFAAPLVQAVPYKGVDRAKLHMKEANALCNGFAADRTGMQGLAAGTTSCHVATRHQADVLLPCQHQKDEDEDEETRRTRRTRRRWWWWWERGYR